MSDGDEQARSDEQLVAQEEDAISIAAHEMAKSLCVGCPGIIETYYPESQTADVQPAIKRKFVGQDPVPAPLCLDVPVLFPGGGNHVWTFPIAKGDEVWLAFADRDIDNWFSSGGVQAPQEIRFHDPSDCVAIPGVSSTPRFMTPAPSIAATELRTRDGHFTLRFENELLSLGVKNVQPALVGTDTKQKLHDLITALVNHDHPTGMGPSGPPRNAPDLSAIDAALDEILSTSVVVQKSP